MIFRRLHPRQQCSSAVATERGSKLPFSVERAVHTPYKHDAFQPRYLVSETLEKTIAEVLALTPERLLAL